MGIAEIETQTGRFIGINREYCDTVGIDAEDMTDTTVNLVTGMEACAAGGQILCSEETRREVADLVECEEGRRIRFKGLAETVQTFSVRGLRDQT